MEETRAIRKKIAEKIKSSQTIAITSHLRPDGDSIGSGIALYLMLKALGKEVRYINRELPGLPLCKLPFFSVIEEGEIDPQLFDLVILIECSTEDRSGQKNLDKYFRILIDHHLSNDGKVELNWVNHHEAAVSVMVYELAEDLGVTVDKTMASLLYCALVSDTGPAADCSVKSPPGGRAARGNGRSGGSGCHNSASPATSTASSAATILSRVSDTSVMPPGLEAEGDGNTLAGGFEQDCGLPLHLPGDAHRQCHFGGIAARRACGEQRPDQTHVHLDAGEIDLHPSGRDALDVDHDFEGLDQRDRPDAAADLGAPPAGQGNGTGLAAQVATRVRLNRRVGLGQQDRRQLVADDDDQCDQQQADEIDQCFFVQVTLPVRGHRGWNIFHHPPIAELANINFFTRLSA